MSESLRAYFAARGGGPSPLLALRRFVAEGGVVDRHSIDQLAAEVRLPASAVRAALSFYADLQPGDDRPRVCRGTACLLAEPLAESEIEARTVYCLGHCDRSPAVLRPDGSVMTECGGRSVEDLLQSPPEQPAVPAVRCVAAEAVVTARLVEGAVELETARRAGVYQALEKALTGTPTEVLEEIEASGLQGRGGAAFPAGRKWRSCAENPGPRFVVANGDEGDPGSFVDRLLMERDPHRLLEGMLLAGWAIGADRGIVFVRSEYPCAAEVLAGAIEQARAAGLLGPAVMGSGFGFEIEVFPALGSYVCGEETALLNAIEGLRGEVRLRPPYPSEAGLFGRPTVVNNVETLVNVPWIVSHGAAAFRGLGTAAEPGTKVLSLSHGFARPGLLEVEFGTPLAAVLEQAGAGRDLAAVLLGGPMGGVVFAEDWNLPVSFVELHERGFELGHGGLIAWPEGADPAALIEHWLEFMSDESCGKCMPCRLGSQRALELARQAIPGGLNQLDQLLELVAETSLCAFGRNVPRPVRQLLERYGEQLFEAAR